ncbi:MAG: ABC transporter permease [Acidobacteria bacterium]|jgi:ABC-type polysaccharide/polyol phosphate export permease|nr:MAG: ABC transporter permease [Acidobacteriota bacterium]
MLKLILQSIKRDFKYSFAGSAFGTIWLFLSPLFQTLVFYYIFEHIIKVRFPKEVTANMPYSAYLIIGIAFWTGFVQAIYRGANSLLDNRNLIKKVPIPPYIYILSSCTVGFLYTPMVLLYSIPLLKFESVRVIVSLLPVIFAWYILALGIALLLASLTVYLRDLSQMLGPLFNFLFYTVPIVYPYSLIPEGLKMLVGINPLFYMIEAVYLQASGFIDPRAIFICYTISLVFFLMGVLVYRRLNIGFYDVL